MSFNKERLLLHSYWKRIKVGMIQDWSVVPEKYIFLLLRYYPQVEAYLGNYRSSSCNCEGGNKMVERTSSEGVDQFEGTVEIIEKVPSQLNEKEEQWHIAMKPKDVKLLKGTKTEMFHEWLRITKTTTENSVAEGSVLDNYLKELEATIPEAKKSESVEAALNVMKGKNLRFIKKVLGKSFEGKQSKPAFVPNAII